MCKVSLSCGTLHCLLCLSPSKHEMLKLSITLTCGDDTFKEQIGIRSRYKAKVMYKSTVTEVFSLDTRSKFLLMCAECWDSCRATKKTWGVVHYNLYIFIVFSVILHLSHECLQKVFQWPFWRTDATENWPFFVDCWNRMEILLHFVFRTSGVMTKLSLNPVFNRSVIFYEVISQINIFYNLHFV